jgi:hypothetical protein
MGKSNYKSVTSIPKLKNVIEKKMRKNLILATTSKIIVVTGENKGNILMNSKVLIIETKQTTSIIALHSVKYGFNLSCINPLPKLAQMKI